MRISRITPQIYCIYSSDSVAPLRLVTPIKFKINSPAAATLEYKQNASSRDNATELKVTRIAAISWFKKEVLCAD